MSWQESLDRIRFYLTQLEQRGNAKAPALFATVSREGVSVGEIVEAFREHLGWGVFTRPYGRYAQAWCVDGWRASEWHAADDVDYASLRALECSLQRMVETAEGVKALAEGRFTTLDQMEGNMPNCAIQQQLDRIAGLLDQLRAADPKVQKAWEAVIQHCSRYGRNHYHQGRLFRASNCPQIQPLDVSGYRDGAVRGLLEEVVETVWILGFLADYPEADWEWEAGTSPILKWFRWRGDAASLAVALIEALEEKVNASPKA